MSSRRGALSGRGGGTARALHATGPVAPAPASAPQPQADYHDIPPPPPPKLPTRAPGGLISPAVALTLGLGVSLPANDQNVVDRKALAAGELGIGWRINSFWELGIWGGGAIGTLNLTTASQGAAVKDSTTGAVTSDKYGSNATYSYGTVGLRLRMHVIRAKEFDGWFGVEVGRFQESWKFDTTTLGGTSSSHTVDSSSAAYGLSMGLDIPIAKTWAIGGLGRFLAASTDNASKLPGGANSDARGFFELGLRVVWSLPLGDEKKEAPGTPVTASTSNALF